MPFVVRKNPGGLNAVYKLYIKVEKAGTATYTYVPPKDFHRYGFDPALSLEQAKELRTRLNKQEAQRSLAERRARVEIRIKEEANVFAAYIPDEAGFLEYAEKNLRFASFKSNKFRSHWHATKKMVTTLKLSPPEYEDSRQLIYKYFAKNQYSYSYCEKILRCLNLYGRFYSKKFKQFVEAVPLPKGYDKSDVEDAYFEKNPDGNASRLLTPELLLQLESGLSKEQYNWMYLSLWCGLRPGEVEGLRKSGSHRWERKEGVDILCVFQTKLKNLPRERRWKRIPMVEKEQAAVRKIVESGEFKKPLVKTLQRILGDGYTCYAGRKGFEKLMTSRGQDYVDVSRWLGHQDLNRTFRDYGDPDEVRFKKKQAA